MGAGVTSDSSRCGASMAYDASSHQTVLFGGTNGAGSLNATWTWDGSTWTQVQSKVSPSARFDAGMAYDPVRAYDRARGALILFGGNDYDGPTSDTWSWTGKTWKQLDVRRSPAARNNMAMAPFGKSVVLVGGFGFADTWTLHR